MGEMADFFLEQEMRADIFSGRFEERCPPRSLVDSLLRPRPPRLDRRSFKWRDRFGTVHRLKDINDDYLANIIRYLKRGEGRITPEDSRKKVIVFLENEAYRRVAG